MVFLASLASLVTELLGRQQQKGHTAVHNLLSCAVWRPHAFWLRPITTEYLKESSEEVEDQCTVCGQLRAPGLVSPAAPAVPGEGRQARPFRKRPEPGQNVAPGGWG